MLKKFVLGLLPNTTKKFIKKKIQWPANYGFNPAKSIETQIIRFNFRDMPLTLEASRSVPLYELIQEIIDYDAYQIKKLNFDGDTNWIVDIGANIGATSLVFSQLQGAQVISFEPLPLYVDALNANLLLNKINNVRVMPYAVSNNDGVVQFNPGKDSDGNAIDVGGRVSEKITNISQNLISVDSLCLKSALAQVPNKRIKLIKIDCEGGEYDLVNQITPDIVSRVENISFEIHDINSINNVKTISRQLKSLGYKLSYKADMLGRYDLHHILASRID